MGTPAQSFFFTAAWMVLAPVAKASRRAEPPPVDQAVTLSATDSVAEAQGLGLALSLLAVHRWSSIHACAAGPSSAEEDILRSYRLHANTYVTKPVDLDHFMSAIRQIDEFFLTVVKLPRR